MRSMIRSETACASTSLTARLVATSIMMSKKSSVRRVRCAPKKASRSLMKTPSGNASSFPEPTPQRSMRQRALTGWRRRGELSASTNFSPPHPSALVLIGESAGCQSMPTRLRRSRFASISFGLRHNSLTCKSYFSFAIKLFNLLFHPTRTSPPGRRACPTRGRSLCYWSCSLY